MIKVNVDEIMEEIRKKVESRGVTEEILLFKGGQKPDLDGDECGSFDASGFQRIMDQAEDTAALSYYHPMKGKRITFFAKRIMRKLNKGLLLPMAEQQSAFNESVVQALLMLGRCLASSRNEENNEQSISELEKKKKKLEKKLGQLKGKADDSI